MARIAVHITPKSARDEVSGWRGGELSIRVSAPPVDGKANEAARNLIAELLHVSKSSVRVIRGESSRHKLVEIDGVGDTELVDAFGTPQEGLF